MTATTASPAPAVAERRLVVHLDRFFPLVWIGLYLLLPVTGDGSEILVSNFDQSRDLEALRSVLADGRADAIADNLIGPAYIATAAVVHWATWLSPEESLIGLSRVSYVLSIAISLLLVRTLVRRLVQAPPSASLAAQVVLVTLAFVAGTWHWSDIPWSHFYAAFLALALYALRFVPDRASVPVGTLTGAVAALLALTRSFEFVAVVAAWLLGVAVLAALHARPRVWRLPVLAAGAVAFAATAAVVWAMTGERGFSVLYRSRSGEAYGDLRPEEIASIPTFELALVPRKLVQLFVDPCFDSLCSLNDYASHPSWRMPLAIQLPALVLLPLCIVAIGSLVVRLGGRRAETSKTPRGLQLLVEMTIASSGLALGYVASTWASSTALQYGFARDFLLAALLSGVVATTVVVTAVYVVFVRVGAIRVRMSPGRATIVVALAGAVLVVVGSVLARLYGLPRIESHHLGAVAYRARCADGACKVAIAAKTVDGSATSIPQASLLTFGCGSRKPRFTIYVREPGEQFLLETTCRSPRLVAAWPTVMGVPPNSSVLRRLSVSNAGGR